VCSPARLDLDKVNGSALKISTGDLERAAPLPQRRPFIPLQMPPTPPLPRRNRLAVTSLILAVLGIPFFGALTGLVAVILGLLALSAIRRTRQKGTGMAVAGVILGVLDMAAWAAVIYYVFWVRGVPLNMPDTQPPDPADVREYPPVIQRAMRANVSLIRRGKGLFGNAAIGSGVILKIEAGEALLITNRHVVDPDFDGQEAEEAGNPDNLTVEVRMIGQDSATGRVVWIAPGGIDLALVQVPCHTAEARVTRWKMGRRVQVGDTVFAIGQPLGNSWSYTRGPVSQFRHRLFGHRRVRIVQTQTPLNPGNSGGGLYDEKGYLVGINTWAVDKRVGEGINFAISIEVLQALAPPGLDLEAGSKRS
jgi:S1-C subfamily serine protease